MSNILFAKTLYDLVGKINNKKSIHKVFQSKQIFKADLDFYYFFISLTKKFGSESLQEQKQEG